MWRQRPCSLPRLWILLLSDRRYNSNYSPTQGSNLTTGYRNNNFMLAQWSANREKRQQKKMFLSLLLSASKSEQTRLLPNSMKIWAISLILEDGRWVLASQVWGYRLSFKLPRVPHLQSGTWRKSMAPPNYKQGNREQAWKCLSPFKKKKKFKTSMSSPYFWPNILRYCNTCQDFMTAFSGTGRKRGRGLLLF